MSSRDSSNSIDAQLQDLRSRISDLGHEIDARKTKTAAALGAAVFLLLLSVGCFYDLATGKNSVWATVGVTREMLVWLAIGLAAAAVLMLAVAFISSRHRNEGLPEKLGQLEQEYAELLDRKSGVSG